MNTVFSISAQDLRRMAHIKDDLAKLQTQLQETLRPLPMPEKMPEIFSAKDLRGMARIKEELSKLKKRLVKLTGYEPTLKEIKTAIKLQAKEKERRAAALKKAKAVACQPKVISVSMPPAPVLRKPVPLEFPKPLESDALSVLLRNVIEGVKAESKDRGEKLTTLLARVREAQRNTPPVIDLFARAQSLSPKVVVPALPAQLPKKKKIGRCIFGSLNAKEITKRIGDKKYVWLADLPIPQKNSDISGFFSASTQEDSLLAIRLLRLAGVLDETDILRLRKIKIEPRIILDAPHCRLKDENPDDRSGVFAESPFFYRLRACSMSPYGLLK